MKITLKKCLPFSLLEQTGDQNRQVLDVLLEMENHQLWGQGMV